MNEKYLKYKLDKETIKLCENNFISNFKIDPYIIRSFKRNSVLNDLKKFKHLNLEFEMPKEINNGKSINCILFYPNHYNGDSKLSIIIFIHGGGFILDGEKLLPYEIANRTNSLVIYPEYSLAPEAKFPIAIEQCYQVLSDCKINKYDIKNVNQNDISVIGVSAGGEIAIALSLLCKQRINSPKINKQLFIYPTTDNNFETDSYKEFYDGFSLTKNTMKWVWKQYTNYYINNQSDTDNPLCCPLKSTFDQLNGLPQTMIITAECDVLRDEGESFAIKLFKSNNENNDLISAFRVYRTIHGFLSNNSLNNEQCEISMNILCDFLLGNNNHKKLIGDNNNNSLLKII